MAGYGKHYDSYEDVLKYIDSKGGSKHLLIGNGFSIAYKPDIFSYKSLAQKGSENTESSISELFQITGTANFEVAIQQLEITKKIVMAIDCNQTKLCSSIQNKIENLKHELINAISQLHPEFVFSIPENNRASCFTFLSPYLIQGNSIISSNYDLLLYWVLMRSLEEADNKGLKINDGFSKSDVDFTGIDNDDSNLIWYHEVEQNIFYLHGALHLFDNGSDVEKERYNEGLGPEGWLIRIIRDKVNNGRYPLFVTEGDGNKKKIQIKHNSYLMNCYQHLSSLSGRLITIGFSFSDSDKHIIEAINTACKNKANGLRSVYVGVYSESDKEHIKEIASQFKCKVNTFDVKTAKIWS